MFVDLTGKKFGKLAVVSRAENNNKNQSMWNCVCECGERKIVLGYSLTSGKTRSCGCQRKESAHKVHFDDLSGVRFGKLIVIERAENRNKHTMWKCECDCGAITLVGANELKEGITKSCGCLRFESKNFTHGFSSTRLYSIWNGIKERCLNENSPAYKWYGGRGIMICEEWIEDFVCFYDWAMENGYKEGLSIERIDVNGNYEPSNCKWIPLKQQALNTRNTRFLTYNGETKTVSEWCDITGIKKSTLLNRIRIGYSPSECFEVPLCSRRGKRRK